MAFFSQGEEDMDKHVKLLQIIWNSRRFGHQRKIEEYLQDAIVLKGTNLHLYPWFDPKLGLADFALPKFSVMI